MENNSVRAYGTYGEIENNDPSLVQEWNSIIASQDNKDMHQLRFGIFITKINGNVYKAFLCVQVK